MARARKLPPRWTTDELERESLRAVERVIETWDRTARYVELFHELRPIVSGLFDATANLEALDGPHLVARPDLIEGARYLAAPILSADDLSTLARSSLTHSQVTTESAERIAEVLRMSLDPIRFAWLGGSRKPSRAKLKHAIDWTTGVYAANRVATEHRIAPAGEQEAAVAELLRQEGFVEVSRRTSLASLDGLNRGEFCRETSLGGAKCDVPVRLDDGRLLALECKVSNSATNSVKRLNRETGGKAETWRRAFGEQVVTAAVLAGIYKVTNLLQAQNEQGVALFWQHDLEPLSVFVARR